MKFKIVLIDEEGFLMKKLTNKDLFQLLNVNGSLTVKVVSSKDLFEESYAENGMIGVIKSFGIEGVYNTETVYEFHIDWDEYAQHNIPLEAHDWNIPKTDNKGTMKEAGYYKEVERLYATDTANSGFEILDENASELKIFKLWQDSGSNMSYSKWTEEMLSRLIKRLSQEEVKSLVDQLKD